MTPERLKEIWRFHEDALWADEEYDLWNPALDIIHELAREVERLQKPAIPLYKDEGPLYFYTAGKEPGHIQRHEWKPE